MKKLGIHVAPSPTVRSFSQNTGRREAAAAELGDSTSGTATATSSILILRPETMRILPTGCRFSTHDAQI